MTIKSQAIAETQITIIDSIMGSGKTSAIIDVINRRGDFNKETNTRNPWIIVTPYLEQIQRFLNETDKNLQFREPQLSGDNKTSDFKKLVIQSANIVTTHSLFIRQPPDIHKLLKAGNYNLIIDEELPLFQEYNEIVNRSQFISAKHFTFMLVQKLVEIDLKTKDVKWKGDTHSPDFKYKKLIEFSQRRNLKFINGTLFWYLNPEIFTGFNSVIIMTYLFPGSILESYFKLYNFPPQKMFMIKQNENEKYVPVKYDPDISQTEKFKDLIEIYEGKYNRIGEDYFALSRSWLLKNTKQDNDCEKLLKLIYNYKHTQHLSTDSIMWTTIKVNDFYEKIQQMKGFKYTKRLTAAEKNLPENEIKKYEQFVPCNARATEMYADRYNLIYFCNRFINPNLVNYFKENGIELDEDNFALSNLVQWIFRSRIRQGEKVTAYIPSKRMRALLIKWLR